VDGLAGAFVGGLTGGLTGGGLAAARGIFSDDLVREEDKYIQATTYDQSVVFPPLQKWVREDD
jgi:hypothetical protein